MKISDYLTSIAIFLLLLAWVYDEVQDSYELKHVMIEHHEHFKVLENFISEWRKTNE